MRYCTRFDPSGNLPWHSSKMRASQTRQRARIEPSIDRANRIVLRVEDAVATDEIEEAAALEHAAHRRLQVAQVEEAAGIAHEVGFLDEELGAGDIDEVDAAADQEDVTPLRCALARVVQLVAHVLDRTEEERPVDAQHRELRAHAAWRSTAA